MCISMVNVGAGSCLEAATRTDVVNLLPRLENVESGGGLKR